jgi:hypothetical protein
LSIPFFKDEHKIRQSCPLSLLLSLLVAEGLSTSLEVATIASSLKGINLGSSCNITHLFVDDILVFCDGSRNLIKKLHDILDLFYETTRMQINMEKSTLIL